MNAFKATGDKELRVVRSDGWVIPVYAYPGLYRGHPHWMVCAASALTNDGFLVLHSALLRDAVARVDRFWVIAERRFDAERVSGVNPSYYFYDPRDGTKEKPI